MNRLHLSIYLLRPDNFLPDTILVEFNAYQRVELQFLVYILTFVQ